MGIEIKHVAVVTCTEADTNYPLTADAAIRSPSITIQAHPDNDGVVTFGGEDLSSTNGHSLVAGASAPIEYTGPDSMGDTNDFILNKIKVRSTEAGDKVTVTYLKEV